MNRNYRASYSPRFSIAEAAKKTGLTEGTIHTYIYRHGIGRKVDGAWSFSEVEVLAILDRKRTPKKPVRAR